jgi:hypothetical protein
LQKATRNAGQRAHTLQVGSRPKGGLISIHLGLLWEAAESEIHYPGKEKEMTDLHKILERALRDEHFGKTLKNDPHEALKQIGVEATPEKVTALKNSISALERAHEAFAGKEAHD